MGDFSVILRELETLRDRLTAAALLESEGANALSRAIAQVHDCRKKRRRAWAFDIDQAGPVLFRVTDEASVKHRFRVDVYGSVSQLNGDRPCGTHSLVARVWCLEKSTWFDAALDSPDIAVLVQPDRGRVMLRFRFEYADAGAVHEPWFHMQVGGLRRTSDEFCRMPENLAVPRFCHHPVSLSMVCQFVVRHFYPEAYNDFIHEPSLKRVVQVAEEEYLEAFLGRVCAYSPTGPDSFLDHVWGQL